MRGAGVGGAGASAAGSPPATASGPVSALTGVLVAVVGVFAFSALLVLLAYAPDLRGGDNGGAQALSPTQQPRRSGGALVWVVAVVVAVLVLGGAYAVIFLRR